MDSLEKFMTERLRGTSKRAFRPGEHGALIRQECFEVEVRRSVSGEMIFRLISEYYEKMGYGVEYFSESNFMATKEGNEEVFLGRVLNDTEFDGKLLVTIFSNSG